MRGGEKILVARIVQRKRPHEHGGLIWTWCAGVALLWDQWHYRADWLPQEEVV